jgi:diguanylate cyclase (GGDEF)-like protein/PAS domain S-box-containing protein
VAYTGLRALETLGMLEKGHNLEVERAAGRRSRNADLVRRMGGVIWAVRLQDLSIDQLLEGVRDAVIVADARSGRIVLWNAAATKMFGYSSSEALVHSWTVIVPERLRAQCEAGMARYCETGHGPYIDSHTVLELPAVRKGGEEITIEIALSPIEPFRDLEGDIGRLVLAVVRDITERKEVEKGIKESEERFRSLVQNTSDIITILEADGTVRYISPAYERVTGYKPKEQIGTNAFGSVHPDDRERALDIFAEVLKKPGLHPPLEFRVPHKDGSWRYLEHVVNNLLDNPAVRGVVVNSWDVTERKALEEQLRHQAFHDPLCGLPNRTLFMDRLERALARANRRGKKVAVLFMDLDNFKIVNDSLGHEVGDELLVAVAERLKACLRPEDTAARFGGDEFTILVEEVDGVSDAVRVAERIAESLQPPLALGQHEVFSTTSIGIALSSPGQKLPADLLRHADLAMYRAKHKGKAGYEVFEPSMGTDVWKRLRLENELRRALERGEFKVYYQPIVTLEDGRIAGAEALVRWEHPIRGLLLPEAFLSVAEDTSLIVRIGEEVLREACYQTREWQERYPSVPPLTVSVNLSPRQFFRPELVAEILAETDIYPGSLQLEITEGILTSNGIHSAHNTLRNLKDQGVQLAVDDFGTGYSSLSYLKRFPVDYLKIDRSFIAGLGQDTDGASKDAQIVSAMTDLTHALGLEAVAEGVETSEQLARLRDIGCEFGQGNYFSEPLPSEALSVLLEEDLTD